VWWSREAQPQRPAWSDDKPVRLGEQTVPAKDPEGKALACYGRSVPTTHHMVWRFVQGRPLRVVTCAFLAWLATSLTAQGKRARVRIWDKASWHVSQAVRAWLKAHKRHAQQAGGCRVMIGRLPSTSPGRNPIEPQWGHGKRAVGEPARVLSMPELLPRICAHYQCELTDPIAQPDC
jgi:transposase